MNYDTPYTQHKKMSVSVKKTIMEAKEFAEIVSKDTDLN